MKIDWNSVREGYTETLEKAAVAYSPPAPPTPPAPPSTEPTPTTAPTSNPMVPPPSNPKPSFLSNLGDAISSPFKAIGGAYDWAADKLDPLKPLRHAMSDAGDFAKSVAPIGMAAVAGGGLLGGGGRGGGGTTNNYYGSAGSKGDLLNYNKAGVSTMGAPRVKVGGFILDPLVAAAERRAANSVLNGITKTTPFGEYDSEATPAPPQPQKHKGGTEQLQLISKYPELAKLLEDEKNKEYLAQLTS